MSNFTRNEKLKLKLAILYIITAVCMLFVLSSCNKSNVETKSTKYIIANGYGPVSIVTIDGCEYLYGDWGHATVLTHKGNCINHNNQLK
jgi:hypothetical protein